MNEKFSILMSVYYKENPIFLTECFDSLINQTLKADEWVLVKDGPLTEELDAVIDHYISLGAPIKTVVNERNMGLGLALAKGITECSNEIIARMDTDDICRLDRFEKQLPYFINNDLDVCGSYINEFENNVNKIIGQRIVPLTFEDIKEYQKNRSAFNHMTVMFKKSAVLRAGNYKDCPLMEDDMLWVEMIQTGSKCANMNDYLVYARTNKDMIARRGGYTYFKKYKNARKKIYHTGYITWFSYFKTCSIQFIVCLMPSFLRKFVFFKILHRRTK